MAESYESSGKPHFPSMNGDNGCLATEFGIRLGLCCLFKDAPIKFRSTTVKYLKKLSGESDSTRLRFISQILLDNANALKNAVDFCAVNSIGSFRISSQLFPCYTHKEVGYTIDDLDDSERIVGALRDCQRSARQFNVRLTMHPDQFVVLNSPNDVVVANSIEELEYHAIVSEYVGCDVINIHAGGVYGDKASALTRLATSLKKLSASVLSRLTLENDDKSYTPDDLLPFCASNNLPFVYDVHHHRCTHFTKQNLSDLEIEAVTLAALQTWKNGAEPLVHISSPKYNWKEKHAHHHDYINFERDFPSCWKRLPSNITVDVEAKAKECAVLRLKKALSTNDAIKLFSSPIASALDDLKKWKVDENAVAVDDDDDDDGGDEEDSLVANDVITKRKTYFVKSDTVIENSHSQIKSTKKSRNISSSSSRTKIRTRAAAARMD